MAARVWSLLKNIEMHSPRLRTRAVQGFCLLFLPALAPSGPNYLLIEFHSHLSRPQAQKAEMAPEASVEVAQALGARAEANQPPPPGAPRKVSGQGCRMRWTPPLLGEQDAPVLVIVWIKSRLKSTVGPSLGSEEDTARGNKFKWPQRG